jgi:O-antigen/teichoic acid export membrane protein
MGLGRAIGRNVFYIYFSQVVRKLANLVFVMVAARLLGAQGYGDFLLVTTMVLTVTAFANFGLRPLIVRMISRETQRTDELLSNVLVVRGALAVLAYAALLAFVHVADYGGDLRALVAIGGIAILFNVVQDSFEAVMLAHQRMRLLGSISVVAALVTASVGVATLRSGLGLRWLFVASVVVQALLAMVMAGLIWRRIARFWPRLELAVAKPLLAASLPFLLAFLLGFMDTKIDVLMLSLVAGPVEPRLAIGYYGPAHTILMGLMLLPRSLNQVLVPVVSQRIYEDQAAVRDIVEKATKFVVLAVSFPVILFTTLFSREIVAILFGPQFGPAAPALAILGWAYGFYALNLPSHSILGSTREMRVFLPVLAGSFVLNVALNLLLIPRYSYLGAAMGSTIVLALGFCARFYFLHRILDMRLSAARPYVKLFLVLLLALFAGYAIRPRLPWLVVALVTALVYGGLVYALRAVEPDEWRFFAGLLRRRIGNETSGRDAAVAERLPLD